MKKIYFYWGNETMSFMRYMTLYSFSIFNPDWEIILIENNIPTDRSMAVNTSERQDKTEYKGKDYSEYINDLNITKMEFVPEMLDLDPNVVNAMSDIHIKDILNWKILAEWGGVVADMDILFVKPFGNAIELDSDVGLVCFSNYPKKDYIPVSFMYSGRPNKFFEDVYRRALLNYNSAVYESCGTPCIKEKNIVDIINKYRDLKIQHLQDEIVFPFVKYPWGTGIELLYRGDFSKSIPEGSVGIHWYGGASLSQKANNLINDESVKKINNTIAAEIRRILCQSPSSP